MANPAWTHRTAVVFIPPAGVWPPIQAIRREHDRIIAREGNRPFEVVRTLRLGAGRDNSPQGVAIPGR